MLKDDFYTIDSLAVNEAKQIESKICLNKDHKIFDGHFPERPIVPGVCMVQIVSELLSQYLDKEVKMDQASSIKFLHVIEPGMIPDFRLVLTIKEADEGFVRVTAVADSGETTLFKLSSLYSI